MSAAPGSIHTTKEAVRAHTPGIDGRITGHLERWRDAVPPGTTVTVGDMVNWFDPSRHGMPMELIMEHLFPPDGSPCAVAGVRGLDGVMPYRVQHTG